MRLALGNGRSLGYLVSGQGAVMVLLHPVGLNAHFWDAVTEHLLAHYRVIAVDCPGHGDSDVPLSFLSLDEIVGDIVTLVSALAPEGAVVAGCSLGGMLAQGVAVARPDLVRGVVISNAGHARDDAGRAALRQRSERALAGMPAVLDDTINRWFSEPFRNSHPDIVKATSDMLLAGDPVVHARTWMAMVDLNYGLHLKRLPMPTMALTGSDDKSVSPEAFQGLVDALPHPKTHIFPGAGHVPPLEVPEDYARVLHEFAAAVFNRTNK